jgi:hypothetical protein
MSDRVDEAQLAAAIEAQEYNLVALLGLAPFPDGDMWCVLWGPSVQEGVAGFGRTPYLAVVDFWKANHRTIKGDKP